MATERTAERQAAAARRALRERGELGRGSRFDRRGVRNGFDAARPVEAGAPLAPPPPEGTEFDTAPRSRNWRDDVIGLSGLNIIAGIWLIIAPWVLGYPVRDPRWNDVVFGAIVGIIALMRVAGGLRDAWLSWVNALIGVWVFVAAFTIDHSSQAISNDIVLGAIVFLFAILSAAVTPRRGGAASV